MLNTRTTGVFNVNFEHMFHFFLFLLLHLNKRSLMKIFAHQTSLKMAWNWHQESRNTNVNSDTTSLTIVAHRFFKYGSGFWRNRRKTQDVTKVSEAAFNVINLWFSISLHPRMHSQESIKTFARVEKPQFWEILRKEKPLHWN